MPRILRIINRLNLGGPTYNAALLSRYLAPEYETLLVAGTRQDTEESSDYIVKNLGLTFTRLPEMKRELNPFADRQAYRAIRKLIREFKPDIVHTHAAKPGTLGRLAAFHESVPVVVHTFHGHVFHSYFSPWKTKIFLGIERYLARRSSAIIAISERQKEELAMQFRVCSPEKIRVIPLGFDLARFQEGQEEKRREFRQKYCIADQEIAVGIIGRLVPVKNHRMFLDSMARVMEGAGRPVKVLIIGDGEERDALLAYSRSLGLNTRYYPAEGAESPVVFTSWIREVDVAIAGLDLVALTSLNEGTPVSLIEAQAGGRAVISTRVGGVENVVSEGITGLLCNSGDTEAMTGHLMRLVTDDPFRTSLGSEGWQHVRERYHYTRLMADMRKLYADLLK